MEKGDRRLEEKARQTVPRHPSSGAGMTRVHSSPWGYLYCAQGQLREGDMVEKGGKRDGEKGQEFRWALVVAGLLHPSGV